MKLIKNVILLILFVLCFVTVYSIPYGSESYNSDVYSSNSSIIIDPPDGGDNRGSSSGGRHSSNPDDNVPIENDSNYEDMSLTNISYNIFVNNISNPNDLNKKLFEIISEDKRFKVSFNVTEDNYDINYSNIHFFGDDSIINYVIIHGLNLVNTTKTIFFPIKENTGFLCIKDLEIFSLGEVSIECNGESEFIVECNDIITEQGYLCKKNNLSYQVSGLKHSAIIEISKNNNDSDLNDDEEIEGLNYKNGYIIGAFIIVIILLVIIFLFFYKRKNKFVDINIDDNTIEENNIQYLKIKNYVQMHKQSYPKGVLYGQLLNAHYSKEVVDKVFKEEY